MRPRGPCRPRHRRRRRGRPRPPRPPHAGRRLPCRSRRPARGHRRQPGVAAVTAGPGVTDAVTGIANAFYANSPMLVLSGKNPIVEFEMGSLQEMDQVTLLSSITKWAGTCFDARRAPHLVATAFRHATSGRMGPTFLDVPLDVQLMRAPSE